MNSQAVIFDRDGVLTYFDVARAQAFFQPLLPFSIFELAQRWQMWGSEVGFPATVEQERTFFAGFWEKLRHECNLSHEQYHALDACNYTDFIQAFPEVVEVLKVLKDRGIAIGVLSNFSLASLEASLAAVGILEWVDVTCAATVIGYAKPKPEAYLHVARLLGTPPASCLFFDDEAPCVAGAQECGMAAYLVDRKRQNDDLSNHVLHNLTGVLDLAF
jgi:putative hydrolase of the HAD superfamily